MNIVLLVPQRRFIANRFGLGYQVPLGLVFLGYVAQGKVPIPAHQK